MGGIRIVIKPHPLIPKRRPEWILAWRRTAATRDHVELVENADADVYPLLGQADILLTDASSIMFYFLALDRPQDRRP